MLVEGFLYFAAGWKYVAVIGLPSIEKTLAPSSAFLPCEEAYVLYKEDLLDVFNNWWWNMKKLMPEKRDVAAHEAYTEFIKRTIGLSKFSDEVGDEVGDVACFL